MVVVAEVVTALSAVVASNVEVEVDVSLGMTVSQRPTRLLEHRRGF